MLSRPGWIGYLLILAFCFRPTLAEDYTITASSWIGDTSQSESVVAVSILSDGRILLGANIYGAGPGSAVDTYLNGATDVSRGTLMFLNKSGTLVEKVVKIADKILDMDIDAQDDIYVAAGNDGLLKLNADAASVIWVRDKDKPCREIDVTPGGNVGAVFNRYATYFAGEDAGFVMGFSSDGDSLFNITGKNFSQDIAMDDEREQVYTCGFRNAHSGCNPVQICYLRAHDYNGQPVWKNYDWKATHLDDCDNDGWENNMADSRGYNVTLGDDGNLYCAFEVAGGNHIFRYEPKDLKTETSIAGGDYWHNFYNTQSQHKTIIGKYDPSTGDDLLIQQFCTRYCNTSSDCIGNALRSEGGDLHADADGRLYFVGRSAAGLPIPDYTDKKGFTAGDGEQAYNPFPVEVYSGGAYIWVQSADFKTREFVTRLSGGNTYSVDVRTLPGEDHATITWAGETAKFKWGNDGDKAMLDTVNALQETPASEAVEGFVAVMHRRLDITGFKTSGSNASHKPSAMVRLTNGRLTLTSIIPPGMLRLYTLRGELLLQREVSQDLEIPLPNLSYGNYLVTLSSQRGQLFFSRIVTRN